MKSKQIFSILITAVFCTLMFSSCGNKDSSDSTSSASGSGTGSSSAESFDISVEYDSDDLDASYSSTDATTITLKSTSVSIDGEGAKASGSVITVSSAGTYIVSGTLKDGQIIVDTDDSGIVKLVLNGANITCKSSAPIYVKDSEKTVITLAKDSANSLTDGTSYTLESADSDEPNAAVFSKSDLTINGSGSLSVDANYNNAIVSKDELKIVSGTLTVHSVDDGIIGKDFTAIKGGAITVTAGGDAIKSTNDTDSGKGFVCIESGTFNLTAGSDGIQAATSILIKDGKFSIKTGGGSTGSVSNDASAKGLKATVDISVLGGSFTISSADDAIHANSAVTITGGTFSISSGDDGIHADSSIAISNAAIDITKSYEGIESLAITISSGTINVTASDDGINGAGGTDSSSLNGRPGQNSFSSASSSASLTINGGSITVESAGDGIDINGSVTMTDGTVIINGPTSDGNAPLDYDGAFKVTGGYILAVGSAGMAQAPDSSSTQYSVMVNFSSAMKAGTLVHIETADGEDVLTFAPTKSYQSVVLCSSALQKGTTYKVYTGGSSTGTSKNGLYSGGSYTGGSLFDSFTVSDIITKVGSYTSQGAGGSGMPNKWR